MQGIAAMRPIWNQPHTRPFNLKHQQVIQASQVCFVNKNQTVRGKTQESFTQMNIICVLSSGNIVFATAAAQSKRQHSPVMNQQNMKVDVSEFQMTQIRLRGLGSSSLSWRAQGRQESSVSTMAKAPITIR